VKEIESVRKYLKDNPRDQSARHYLETILPENPTVEGVATEI